MQEEDDDDDDDDVSCVFLSDLATHIKLRLVFYLLQSDHERIDRNDTHTIKEQTRGVLLIKHPCVCRACKP
jgi:hypothetical protein